MTEFDFTDRYAQSGLNPTSEIVSARQASAARVRESASKEQLLDLVATYYGLKPDLTWFRDELRKEDPTFSLATNERESVILAAIILFGKVADDDPTAILGTVVGSIQGRRVPTEATWLLDHARSAMTKSATTARIPLKVRTEIKLRPNQKLGEEITAAATDLGVMAQVLAKVRNESQQLAQLFAREISEALDALQTNALYQREESQILWWLFGEHSRSLGKPFSVFQPAEAALIGGIELGQLTTASLLGPVAAPAVLERIIQGSKREKEHQQVTLMTAVDGLGADLAKLKHRPIERPNIYPVLAAIDKANEIGSGGWAIAFQRATGLDANIAFEPLELAVQVYYEYLLGDAE
jgi:hypothetical protein